MSELVGKGHVAKLNHGTVSKRFRSVSAAFQPHFSDIPVRFSKIMREASYPNDDEWSRADFDGHRAIAVA
jgi:hypothetical protein